MLLDAHNHLQDDWLAPHLDTIVAELERLAYGGAVVNGTHPDDWARVAELAARFPWVRPSYGLHPWQCGRRTNDWREQLEKRLNDEPHAAVGEIGIDRWILDQARPDDPRLADTTVAPFEEQLEAFRWQFTWGAEQNRAITVHCLRAWGPLIDALEHMPRAPRGFLLHAYGGSAELVPRFVKLGAYFSFGPAFLDPRKTRQREAFKAVPSDRLLVETDAPAMPPPPEHIRHPLPDSYNGTRVSSPANLPAAYAALAELHGVPEDQLQAQVAENFVRLFGEPTADMR